MGRSICSTPDCGRFVFGHGLCNRCYKRERRGAPLDAASRTPAGAPLAWLQDAVASAGEDCQIWPFSRSSTARGKRYGKLEINGKTLLAHRVAMQLAGIALPENGMEACHSCGRGRDGCVNWRHLRVDTKKANAADRVLHGTAPIGSRNPRAKLSENDALAIRKDVRPVAEIARAYGVSPGAIYFVRSGATWRHVEVGA